MSSWNCSRGVVCVSRMSALLFRFCLVSATTGSRGTSVNGRRAQSMVITTSFRAPVLVGLINCMWWSVHSPLPVKIYWPRVKSSYERGSPTTTGPMLDPLELLLGVLASLVRQPKKSHMSMSGFYPTLIAVRMPSLRTTATTSRKAQRTCPRPMTGCRYGSQLRF